MKNKNIENGLDRVRGWMIQHKVLGSCLCSLLIGLAMGAVTSVLYYFFC